MEYIAFTIVFYGGRLGSVAGSVVKYVIVKANKYLVLDTEDLIYLK